MSTVNGQYALPGASTSTSINAVAPRPASLQLDAASLASPAAGQSAPGTLQRSAAQDMKPIVGINDAAAAGPDEGTAVTAEVMQEWRTSLPSFEPLTRIRNLPADKMDEHQDPTFEGQLPQLSASEIAAVRAWLDADVEHLKSVAIQTAQHSEILDRLKSASALRPAWWELIPSFPKNPALAGAKLNIVWPVEKKNRREQHRKRGKTAPRL